MKLRMGWIGLGLGMIVGGIMGIPASGAAGASENCVQDYCNDPDNGNQPLQAATVQCCKKGQPISVIFNGQATQDACTNGKILIEWLCVNNAPQFVTHNCWTEFQKPCVLGACGAPKDVSDTDNDSIADKFDNCPTVKNVQFDANDNFFQPDSDVFVDPKTKAKISDGFGDVCDNCPLVWNKDQKDSDGDGVGDACDNCPFTPNKDQDPALCQNIQCAEIESVPAEGGALDLCTGPYMLSEKSCNPKDGTIASWVIDCKAALNWQCGVDAKTGYAACVPGGADGVDTDKDGFPDVSDNCPKKANPDQKDSDGDGFGDVCDNCPILANPNQKDSDGNGTGDVCEGLAKIDTDKDGVPDASDNCPATPNPDQKDGNGNGIGDACDVITQSQDGNDPEGGGGGNNSGCDPAKTTQSDKALGAITTLNLYAVAGGLKYQSWVGGEGGNIFVRLGQDPWKKIPSPWDFLPPTEVIQPYWPEDRDITALWSPDGNALFAATRLGYLFRWEGSGAQGSWQQVKKFSASLYAIAGLSVDDFWVAGGNGALWHHTTNVGWVEGRDEKGLPVSRQKPDMREFSKTVPSALTDTSRTWRGLAVLLDQVWVVGDNGSILRKKYGIAQKILNPWLDFSVDTPASLRTVWSDGATTFVGGSGGTILCGNGNNWQTCVGGNADATILQIAGPDIQHLYAAGSHSTFLVKQGGDPMAAWNPMPLPFPNSVTAVWASEQSAVAGGINGTVYTVGNNVVTADTIAKKEVAHPEWTATRWTAFQGKLTTGGNLDEVWLAGDDLAVARYQNGKWSLVHSDEGVVPFAVPSSPQRDLEDLYRRSDGIIFAVGDVNFVLKGDSTGWKHVALPVASKPAQSPPVASAFSWNTVLEWSSKIIPPPPPPEIHLKMVRPIPNGSILVAGNLGVWEIDAQDQLKQLLPKITLTQGAVADWQEAPGNMAWIAVADGAWRLGPDNPQFLAWGAPDLTPVYINGVADQMVVVGDEVAPAKPFWAPPSWGPPFGNAPSPKSHYRVSNGTVWKDANYDFPERALRIRPFFETVTPPYTDPIQLIGMAVLGEKGRIALRLRKAWLPFQTELQEDWYDGAYTFAWDYDANLTTNSIGIPNGAKVTYWYDIHVVGVGGHNAVHQLNYHYERTCKKEFF